MKGSSYHRKKNAVIDRNEYLLLQLIRARKFNVANVAAYYTEFDGLNTNQDGVITISKLKKTQQTSSSEEDGLMSIIHSNSSNNNSRPIWMMSREQKYNLIDFDDDNLLDQL